ncbi:MAG: RNA methyltransferase [Flavipsychrobacter sp.]|nr:RNA methyltransferase [Flavipsychrobacter sp.]
MLKELPGALLQQLQSVEGFDEAAFKAAHQEPAVTSVRLHPVKGSDLYGQNKAIPWCPDGRYLPQRPVFTTDPAYHAGAYYVQEASSMFLDYMFRQVVGNKTGLRVLDLCAAPGGKSTLIASLLDRDSLLISNEVIRPRSSILEENMIRWGYSNTWVTSNDPRDFGKIPGYFDVIVADVPCSGSGLFRKDEKALDEWSIDNVNLCSQRQQRILADVWPALKQDGILIYATCSYSPQEDEEILDWLADTYDAATVKVDLPEDWGVVAVTSKKRGMCGYRFFPDKIQGEGFFIAAIQKKDVSERLRYPRFKTANNRQLQEQASFLLQPQDYCFLQTDNYTIAINPQHEEDLQILQKTLYFRKAGIALGEAAGKDWLPAHNIALSVDTAKDLAHFEVNKEQALHYLKKEEMGVLPDGKGWYMVTYNGLGLGWLKALGNRANNYLPKNWRIRMEITDSDWA